MTLSSPRTNQSPQRMSNLLHCLGNTLDVVIKRKIQHLSQKPNLEIQSACKYGAGLQNEKNFYQIMTLFLLCILTLNSTSATFNCHPISMHSLKSD
jgi:hypothetical protein